MPETVVYFYQEEDGTAPVLEWLEDVRSSDKKAYANCLERIERLRNFGHELRRPHADYLEDGIYELRAKRGRVQYRILYFFHGQNVAILDHGLTKEDAMPKADLARAKERKGLFEQNPDKHTYSEE